MFFKRLLARKLLYKINWSCTINFSQWELANERLTVSRQYKAGVFALRHHLWCVQVLSDEVASLIDFLNSRLRPLFFSFLSLLAPFSPAPFARGVRLWMRAGRQVITAPGSLRAPLAVSAPATEASSASSGSSSCSGDCHSSAENEPHRMRAREAPKMAHPCPHMAKEAEWRRARLDARPECGSKWSPTQKLDLRKLLKCVARQTLAWYFSGQKRWAETITISRLEMWQKRLC